MKKMRKRNCITRCYQIDYFRVFVCRYKSSEKIHYNKMDTSLIDTTMFIDDDEQQHKKISRKNSPQVYRLVTLISLILFLVCLIILLITLFHKKQHSRANNSPALTQGSTCNNSRFETFLK